MSRNSKLEDLDMTREELNQIKEAFEKEEFRKMFADYIEEVNDPKNKAIYEREITQMERERGVDVTFVYPNPGYVIKTSAEGKQKAFINICHNENVGRPSSRPGRQGDSLGLDWSLPYIQASPRIDLDKSRNRCVVYDVLFHPDTLHLAKNNATFRKFVNDTALAAVEDNYKVKLDKVNIKFPKMAFKGAKQPTVIRRKRTSSEGTADQEDLFEIPNYPYEPLKEDPVPIVTKLSDKSTDLEPYTTPAYVIKQRKGVDMHEYSNALDSKFHVATPTELSIIIDLPLIKSASDVTLDVYEKSLSLASEKPAKYRLDVKLPWHVDEDNGDAKFDKSTKKLHVTLPVKRGKFAMSDLVREDSGIESDHNQSAKSSSEEDISECAVEVLDDGETIERDFRTSRAEEPIPESFFLDPKLHYSLPSFTLNALQERLAITVDVQNVDSSSVKWRMIEGNQGVQLSLLSVGSGFFPINYAFCIKFPEAVLDESSVSVKVSEDNLVLHVRIGSGHNSSRVSQYFVGTAPDNLSQRVFPEPIVIANLMTEPKAQKQSAGCRIQSIEKKHDAVTLVLSKLKLSEEEASTDEDDVLEDKSESKSENISDEQSTLSSSETPSAVGANKEISSETSTKEEVPKKHFWKSEAKKKEKELQIQAIKEKIKAKKQLSPKNRAHSLCTTSAEVVSARRSILKCSQSLSESYADDYSAWSSVDSSDSCIPEEMANGAKKTVRFSDIITQKYFRANSSILGQRKKNQRKTKNKRKALERRASESEASASECEMTGSEIEASDTSASDVSDVSDGSEVEENLRPPESLPSSKKHRRRGQKNRRKNASTAKHNVVLNSD